MPALTPAQRKYLKRLAHALKPVVLVGKQGMSESLIGATDRALNEHELIKVRFNEFKEDKHELSARLVEATGSALCGIVGNTATLYRPRAEKADRDIQLPD